MEKYYNRIVPSGTILNTYVINLTSSLVANLLVSYWCWVRQPGLIPVPVIFVQTQSCIYCSNIMYCIINLITFISVRSWSVFRGIDGSMVFSVSLSFRGIMLCLSLDVGGCMEGLMLLTSVQHTIECVTGFRSEPD